MFSNQFFQDLEKTVERLEESSSVELVVIASPGSGNYAEVDARIGFLTSLFFLLVAIYSPWDFTHDILVVWLILGYGIGWFSSSRLHFLRKPFLSKERLKDQAERSAREYFVLQRLSHTRERTGLLLYLSFFERKAILLADLGIEAKVAKAMLNDLESDWAKAKDLGEFEAKVLAGLETLIEPLSSALPRAQDDENELPNEICLVQGGFR